MTQIAPCNLKPLKSRKYPNTNNWDNGSLSLSLMQSPMIQNSKVRLGKIFLKSVDNAVIICFRFESLCAVVLLSFAILTLLQLAFFDWVVIVSASLCSNPYLQSSLCPEHNFKSHYPSTSLAKLSSFAVSANISLHLRAA